VINQWFPKDSRRKGAETRLAISKWELASFANSSNVACFETNLISIRPTRTKLAHAQSSKQPSPKQRRNFEQGQQKILAQAEEEISQHDRARRCNLLTCAAQALLPKLIGDCWAEAHLQNVMISDNAFIPLQAWWNMLLPLIAGMDK
jgi:hypothetical protein